MKRNLRTGNWEVRTNLPFLSPAAFHAFDSRTETKTWIVVVLVPKHPGETGESLHPCRSWDWGLTFGREGLSSALSRAGWSIGELAAAPCSGAGRWASPPTGTPSPQGQSPNTPSGSPRGPRALSPVFLCSYPAALLAHAGAAEQPPPPCLGSPPVWPSACSRADFSSQNHSPGPGWAGKQDFLTLFCLMLEERPARQNWWNLKIAQHQLSLSASLSYKLVPPKRNPKSEPGCLKRAITTKPSFSLPAVCWMLFRVYDRITIRRRSPRSVVGDACRGPRGWCEAALPSSLCLPLQGLSWAPGDPT